MGGHEWSPLNLFEEMEEPMSTVKLEIVTPEALVVSQDVGMVVVPGSEGDMGVKPGHAPTISTLRDGSVRVYANGLAGGVTGTLDISGGFVDITPEACRVLCESAAAA